MPYACTASAPLSLEARNIDKGSFPVDMSKLLRRFQDADQQNLQGNCKSFNLPLQGAHAIQSEILEDSGYAAIPVRLSVNTVNPRGALILAS